MTTHDALWIAGTVVFAPVIALLAGFALGLAIIVLVAGILTAPVWVPLSSLGRWLLWKYPGYRLRVLTRFWIADIIDRQKRLSVGRHGVRKP